MSDLSQTHDVKQNEVEGGATTPLTSTALHEFLMTVPTDLLSYAAQVVAQRIRQPDVETAAAALEGLNNDGLVEVLSHLTDETRASLKAALG